MAANLQASRLTVLYGASGVGKSSLLRAGVAHHLRRAAAGGANHVGSPCARAGATIRIAMLSRPPRGGGPCATRSALPARSWRTSSRSPIGSRPGRAASTARSTSCSTRWRSTSSTTAQAEAGRSPVRWPTSSRVRASGSACSSASATMRWREPDALKARIPGLFGNLLRLDHLTREEGRHAIVGPLAELTVRGQQSSEGGAGSSSKTVLDQVTSRGDHRHRRARDGGRAPRIAGGSRPRSSSS